MEGLAVKNMNSKMDRDGVITKDKKQFLIEERHWFPSMTNREYKDHMHDDAENCKRCGIWYWNGCLKRCKCEED